MRLQQKMDQTALEARQGSSPYSPPPPASSPEDADNPQCERSIPASPRESLGSDNGGDWWDECPASSTDDVGVSASSEQPESGHRSQRSCCSCSCCCSWF